MHRIRRQFVAAVMAVTLVALAVAWWRYHKLPMMLLVSAVVVFVFGTLTLYLRDETFIKLKPTIVNCLFGVILGGGLLFLQRPLLKPIFGAAFRLTDEGWRKLTLRWALFFAPMTLTSLKSRAHASLVRAGGGPGRNWLALDMSQGMRVDHCTAAGAAVGT